MGTQGAAKAVRGGADAGDTGGARGAAAPGDGAAATPGRAAPRGRAVARAAVVVCALGLLGPLAPAAYASAGRAADGPDGRPPARETADGPDAGGAGPGTDRLARVHRQIEDLYRAAERATDAYNAAQEQVTGEQKKIVELARRIDAAQRRRDALKRQAGVLASAQYRAGGIPDEARLLLHADPEGYLDNVVLARKSQRAATNVAGELSRLAAGLRDDAHSATVRWEHLDAERVKKEKARSDIRKKIDAAKKIESRLAAAEKDRLKELEESRARAEQQKWLDTGILKEIDNKASAAGRKAVSFATAQIGKDYVWGAVGPDTFDCSGLTLRAWQAGGRTIPRTSQEQWRQLPHVAVRDLRPGDLIIYFSDASHVGMYLGDGAVVHAPRPGRQVTITGAGSMPILGVVRPDK
ncbi:C40 family peptidase [Streptomyces catenulae]|uniref:NlpC/P60 family protein n=1 Tax=Streptomyces catenulae TaxID=66875 RepID=A0ABV2Z5K8_9ACTN|nr:C40 family peptidase [Streptomyces catenulae]